MVETTGQPFVLKFVIILENFSPQNVRKTSPPPTHAHTHTSSFSFLLKLSDFGEL